MKFARAFFAIMLATAFAYTLTSSASAAGVNCDNFASPQEAQDFFIANGGSPTNNVEGLDRDHDGFACEATAGNTSGGGGGGTDVPADNTGDVPADNSGTDVPSDTGSTDTGSTSTGGDVSNLPNTGSGTQQNNNGQTAAVLALFSVLALGASAQMLRRRQA